MSPEISSIQPPEDRVVIEKKYWFVILDEERRGRYKTVVMEGVDPRIKLRGKVLAAFPLDPGDKDLSVEVLCHRHLAVGWSYPQWQFGLEPASFTADGDPVLISIAISAKRIADAIEIVAQEIGQTRYERSS